MPAMLNRSCGLSAVTYLVSVDRRIVSSLSSAWYAAAMGRVAERSKLAAAEYLVWEREQPVKHEFFDGEVFAMAGGTPRHNALGISIGAELRAALRSRGCSVLSSDQQLAFPPDARYVYPDVTVICGSPVFQPGTDDVITNPAILVEVLSSSTEEYDRGLKWTGYQRIASLTDYLLVAQAEARIEHYRRNADGSWTYRAAGPGERVVLTGGGQLAVDAVYAGVFDLPGG
jgi:Uma2 family endonuclease